MKVVSKVSQIGIVSEVSQYSWLIQLVSIVSKGTNIGKCIQYSQLELLLQVLILDQLVFFVGIGMNTRLVSRHDDFDDLMKFLEMLLQIDCYVRVFYGGSVRREDGMFEDIEEELEWFDEPLASAIFVSV